MKDSVGAAADAGKGGETDLVRLEQMLMAATGPDRAVDRAFHNLLYPPRVTKGVKLPPNFGKIAGVDPGFWGTEYTASIDAALALVQQLLAGWWPELTLQETRASARVCHEGNRAFYATAPTPALAVCLALVRALRPSPASELIGETGGEG